MTTPNDPYNQGGQPQGGYQQQPGGYPPAAPPLNESELRRPARPKTVDTAYLLWLIAAGLAIVANLIGFAIAEDIARETAAALGVSDIARATDPSYGSLIFSLLLSVVWILVVMQMRKGANWARIVLTVLGGLSVIAGLISLLALGIMFSVGFLGVISVLLGLVQLAVTIGAIVFMFMSDSNYYFKAS
jgi:hypothetical protein